MTRPPETSPEALLEHARWMRALAVGLVSDPNDADDVAQDTTLAALLHPPPAGAALRPWLATVLRRVAGRRRRSERRRVDHELGAHPPEGQPGHIDALERIDTQRMLLDAVRGLEEPLRTTVVRRYFEGETSAEIARASGVPAGTVRARLKRALDRLREQLDRDSGSRGAWIALIAPLVPREPQPPPVAAGSGSGASLPVQGILTMSLAKLALSGATVVLAAFAVWKLSPSDADDVTRAEPAAPSVPSDAASGELDTSEPAPSRATVSAEPGPAIAIEPVTVNTAAGGDALSGSLDARFVDEHGAPWGDVEVLVFHRAKRARDPRVLARGGGDGTGFVTVTVELPNPGSRRGGTAWELELLARGPDCASHRQSVVVHADRVTHLGDIVLCADATASGWVVDERGAAVPDARVGAVEDGALEGITPEDLDRIARVGSEAFDFLSAVPSRADGGFDLAGLRPGRVRLWAHAPGLRFGLSEPFELEPGATSADVRVVLADFLRTDRISGRVVGPDGVGRRAWLTRNARAGERSSVDHISTDEQGNFGFEVEYLDALYNLSADDPVQEFARVQVRDVRPGDLDVVIAFGHGEPLLVHLRDGEGEPVLDAEISIGIDGSYRVTPAESAAPGDYVIELPTGKFSLSVEAPGFCELYAGRHDAATIRSELELVMERALKLTGVVLADGEPVPGATVEVFEFDPEAREVVDDLRCTISSFEGGRTRTGADGRFELDADVEGLFVVRARHSTWVDAEVGPLSSEASGGALELELSRGGTIAGFVRVPPDEPAGGRVVAVHRGDGRPRCTRTEADGSYRFEGLMPGEWRVFPLEEELDPNGSSFSGYDGDEPLEWDCRVEIGATTPFDLDLTER